MVTVDENGNVLDERRLRIAKIMNVPYEQATPEAYRLWQSLRHAQAYSTGPLGFTDALRAMCAALDAIDQDTRTRGASEEA